MTTGANTIHTHAGAKVLSFGSSYPDLYVWMLVDTDIKTPGVYTIGVYGTGWNLPDYPGTFIGTVRDSEDHVRHAFIE